MTAPQDPFSTPPQGGAAGSPGGYGAPGGPTPSPYGTQPGGGAPGYGTPPPPYGTPVAGPPRNGFGIAAIVLGVLALLTSLFFGGLVFGIPAIVFGALGLRRAKRREATNGGVSIAGLVLGVISLLVTGAVIAFGVSLLKSEEGKDYQDCLRDAAGDRAAIEQCAEQFSEQVGG